MIKYFDVCFYRWFRKKKEITFDPMKYLIVGLGNMGRDYEGTRHNIGFEVVEYLAKEHTAPWKDDTYGDLTVIKHKGRTFHLLKPSTFMNLSGKAVRYWCQKLKIANENLLIITDDINIQFGEFRIRKKGSDGGHNGLKNIQEILGTIDYARMRIGVGSNFSRGRQVNYVLGKWNEDEKAQLSDILKHAADAVLCFGTLGIEQAMTKYTKKIKE